MAYVYDRRRLTNEAHIFITRKAGKTEFGGAIDFAETMALGDTNAQALICANSRDQAKIAFAAVSRFAQQVDPASITKGGGKLLRVTTDEVNFRPGYTRTGNIKVMSAGGKKKDGLYASVVHADEHGSAEYTNGNSDMQRLVEVCIGSAGPRRERLLLHTTTAGLVNEGPYQLQLRGVEEMLVSEMDIPLPKKQLNEAQAELATKTKTETESLRTEEDKWFAFLLRLDPWDWDGDNLNMLNHDHLFRKVNRSIGITVQPTWYRERLHEARKNIDTRKEVLTKDFNIWQTDRVVEWISGDEIRRLQIDRRIEDCIAKDGWLVLTGMDFTNVGDDLQASSYLAARRRKDGRGIEFFADMDAWMTEEAAEKSPLRDLFYQWRDEGWLHIEKGNTVDAELPVNRIVNLRNTFGVNMIGFGYDPFKAKGSVNLLKTWLMGMGIREDKVGNFVMPVQQTFGGMNPLIDELTECIRRTDPLIHFSMNPLWPWEFQNCMLIDNPAYELRKIVKSKVECKVDNCQALCDAFGVYDRLSVLVVK